MTGSRLLSNSDEYMALWAEYTGVTSVRSDSVESALISENERLKAENGKLLATLAALSDELKRNQDTIAHFQERMEGLETKSYKTSAHTLHVTVDRSISVRTDSGSSSKDELRHDLS